MTIAEENSPPAAILDFRFTGTPTPHRRKVHCIAHVQRPTYGYLPAFLTKNMILPRPPQVAVAFLVASVKQLVTTHSSHALDEDGAGDIQEFS